LTAGPKLERYFRLVRELCASGAPLDADDDRSVAGGR
jgi:hypothetical protein